MEKTKTNLSFHPLKDIILYSIGVFLIAFLFLLAFFLKPKSSNSHVEIRYENTLLYEVNDKSKNTQISFPSEGEKKITYKKEDGVLFGFKEGFLFEGESITLTIYSDKSIQIKKEDVTCCDHVCSGMGRIYQTYTPIVCLPNHFQAMIVASSFPETIN